MLRRTLLLSAAALALPTRAQVIDLSDAINKAGRQRMLSQRMGKAWLSIAQGVEPESAPMMPTSVMPASAQLRGQPLTAYFTLCGAYMRHMARSRSLPICVLSCVPMRHHSLPTQVLTVRRALA